MNSTITIFVTPVDYSGDGWAKGVQTDQARNTFFFVTNDISQLAIKPGDSAEFVSSGHLKVTKVTYLNTNGRFNVYVTVDKPLSPAGDGFPYQVLIRVNRPDKRLVTPVNYTGADWKRGVLTTGQRNCFYFVARDAEQLAIKAGDFAQFALSGRQKIQKVEYALNDNGFFSIFITVDKALDPEGDGFPKQVQIHAN